nr:uracil phosphoribosyltransferase-like isoform X5 [Ziziphus jujuba var. spinosa]XP_048319368.1 uracil phosphoribosyltransferase-like isoform X5 [Ziziphus jujuba var. spinosa]
MNKLPVPFLEMQWLSWEGYLCTRLQGIGCSADCSNIKGWASSSRTCLFYFASNQNISSGLPDTFPEGSRIFVVDPMLATGGTIVAPVNLLKERGIGNQQIKVICAVAAPPALQKLSENFPGLPVYTGIIDPTVNDKG